MSDFRASDPYLQKRYGLRKRAPRWVIPAIISILIGGGWFAWTTWFHIHNSVSAQIITYSPIAANEIRVNYSFMVSARGAHYACTFIALDGQTNVVGEINQPLPVGPAHGGSSVIIKTRANAASATIDSCFALR